MYGLVLFCYVNLKLLLMPPKKLLAFRNYRKDRKKRRINRNNRTVLSDIWIFIF